MAQKEIVIPNNINTRINSSIVFEEGDSMQHIMVEEKEDKKPIDISKERDKTNYVLWVDDTKKVLSKQDHINPISTEINIEVVADQLSNYQFAPGMTVSVDELLTPTYDMDYDAHPANS